MRTRASLWEAAGAAAAGVAALGAVADTDLWWHLSAGRRVLEEHAVPRADWLSWTLPGAPWTDFEWLAQAAFAASHLPGGAAGLWALKAVLLSAAAAGVLVLARAAALAAPGRAAALALFGAAVLPRADLRTELFSLVLFAWAAALLERRRAAGWPEAGAPRAAAAAFLAFALWSNLHAGFAVGLALLVAYALDAALTGRRAWLAVPAAAAAATLANPFGWGVWRVLLAHGADAPALRGLILEWGPLSPSRLPHAGAIAAVAAAAAVTALAAWRGRLPGAPEVLALGVAAASARHARLCGYAAVLMPLAASAAARAAHGLWERRGPRRLAAALCAAAFALAVAAVRPWRLAAGPVDPSLVPARAAAWLSRRPELRALKAYNPWSWGGYLGWRLGPGVFQDGRYLFHGLLAEQAAAAASPESWQAFLEGRGVELALLEDEPLMRPSRFVSGGRETPVERPYWVSYMPRERWALVWTDGTALVFVRRDRLPASVPELRWLKPRDGAALALARAAGLVDEAALAAETERVAREGRELTEDF